MINKRLISSVMVILDQWNPLGEKAKSILDLNHYQTEAMDIINHIRMFNIKTQDDFVDAVSEILNEAFDLNLSREDCISHSKKIYKLLKKTI